MLDDGQLLRYNRQILLNEFDVAGQERLLAASVLVVGLGGLGCPVALYLAAAGVGRLLLADGDAVELGNLQRQIAHGDADLGRNKASSAAAAIAALNPEVAVEVIPRQLQEGDLPALLQGVDVVVDAIRAFHPGGTGIRSGRKGLIVKRGQEADPWTNRRLRPSQTGSPRNYRRQPVRYKGVCTRESSNG